MPCALMPTIFVSSAGHSTVPFKSHIVQEYAGNTSCSHLVCCSPSLICLRVCIDKIAALLLHSQFPFPLWCHTVCKAWMFCSPAQCLIRTCVGCSSSSRQAATRFASTAAACVPGDLTAAQSGCCAQMYTRCRPAAGSRFHELSADIAGVRPYMCSSCL